MKDEGDPDPKQAEPAPQNIFENQNAIWWDGGDRAEIGEAFDTRRLNTPLDQVSRRGGGRRSNTRTDQKRGRYIQARPSAGKAHDLAFDATLRAAAPFQKSRKELRKHVAFAVRPGDYQKKVRVRRAANLILFLVDASWSMAVTERMNATKGAILSLLTDAYQRRDRVGLITFQKNRANLVLPPTSSVELAQQALEHIPVGGKTPLSAGLNLALKVLKREMMLHPDVMPLLIVLTDGAGNVTMGNLPPQEEANFLAESIAAEKIHSLVINMESPAFDQGLAAALAEHLKAPCYSISDLKAENLYHTVRQEMVSYQSGASSHAVLKN